MAEIAALRAYRQRLLDRGDLLGARTVDRCIALLRRAKGKPYGAAKVGRFFPPLYSPEFTDAT